jgi:hypothetical protein
VAGIGGSYALEHALAEETNELDFMKILEPNKPDSQKAAIALRLHSERQWRGVCDPGRSPK